LNIESKPQNTNTTSSENLSNESEVKDNQPKKVEQERVENNYLSPKALKLKQKREQLKKELETIDNAISEEIKEARKKSIDAIVNILDKNGLLDVSSKVWKDKIIDVVKILKQ
jgi:predicted transcriptional regulator